MATIFMIPRGAPNEDDHVVLSVGGRDYKIYKGVEYVVREKGEWVYDHWCEFKCSKCGALSKTEPRGEENFCPNCGADMRIEEQNRARSDCDSVDICIEWWDEWLEMPTKDGETDEMQV